MKHLQSKREERVCESSLWDFYFHGCRTGILDIETTGLSRQNDRFILGGLYDASEGIMHQILAEDRSEEAQALRAFMELTEQMDVIVTYNGRHFDVPFLQARMAAHGMRAVPFPYDLDLYQVVSGNSPIRRFVPNLRQKTLENYMGLWQYRSDEISGADSAEMYDTYARTKDPELERQILLHNSDDCLQLTRLTGVISKCDFHRAMHRAGFPAADPKRRLQVRRIRLWRDELQIEGDQGRQPVNYQGFELDGYPVQMQFRAEAGSFAIQLPLVRQEGIAAVDLLAAGLEESEFTKYPGCGSGFLVLQQKDDIRYMEINHLVRAFIRRLEDRRIIWN